MTQLNKNARARRRAQRARVAAIDAVTARLLGGTTTGRARSDDMVDAMRYGYGASPKLRGMQANAVVIDELTDLKKFITP